ncbi:MAG: Flp pilus assembly complex ATPase component TadA [Clostridia bacterium]|nr:Flp pilus assembly complex ATPase component TadA [Clostridia bacterium]MBR4799090.1 Flp pilus assembly complex ATPase component TadA [Clostridia bacterium]
MLQVRLGELLLSAGAITEEELERGLALQKKTKERLGTVLISNGIITEAHLIEALQMQLGIDYVDLTKVNIPIELAQVVPKNLAKQYQVVPVKVVKDELYLAMSDPLNFYATEEVRKAVHKKIIPLVSTAAAIDHAIQTLYGNEGAARAIEEMKREAANSGEANGVDNAFISNQLGDDAANSAPTIRLVNSIIERAIVERSSDIHIEPRENDLQVRMRIDGLMRDILTVPKDLQASVISRIKIMSGMDISERRIPQDGRFNVRIKKKDIDLRVSTLPTVFGEKIVARLLDKSAGRISKAAVGLEGSDLEKFDKMLHCKSGVLLVVGPTGSGKSTTMYVMINELNTREVNLITLEDPVEYNIDGVNQVQINEKTGLTFASGLRAILRQDPDIIAVGEIRDGETAEIAMRSAITGHIVLSTLHTNDAVGTIERLQDMGVENYLISSALRGIISQRLVRRICPNCRKEYEPTDEELADLGVERTEGLKFYHGAGCPECFNTGYRGRVAVFEMLPVNSKVRALISKRASREEIESALKSEESGFVSLRDNALRLVKEGLTTGEEIIRVINEED